MSEKWTPGPWRIEGKWVIADDNSFSPSICNFVVDGLIGSQHEPNAHLIAASPDLYEALNEGHPKGPEFLDWIADRLVNVYGEPPEIDFVLALRRKAEKSRAALAKARGEVSA